ncbi:MAG: glycoside hydrolase family 127 protein [Sedimentisphaerales bacterium]|nr:glycoside hydrolase family 127 protein [Sedimentisphaerales bacterium]
MSKTYVILISIILGAGILAGGCEEAARGNRVVELKRDYPIESVGLRDVSLEGGFWGKRLEMNREVTIPHIFKQCQAKGRIDNFAIAGGSMQGEPKGNFPFDDTDVYKAIEAASYSLMTRPDPNLEKYLDEIIAKIAAAQEEDGYLYTARTNKYKRLANWYGPQRWSRVDKSHELYDAGHLYEAAAAHYLTTGKRTLLNVAMKNADMLCKTFGPDKLHKWPGHQVIEMGLVKLYRVTGERRYLDLAKFFLDVRGPRGGEYAQAHKKPVDQNEAVGHAVRAAYMYGGMTDIAALTREERYAEAAERIWENVVGRKMYITGGIGSKGDGEAFGKDYEMPNETAYCETCAAIGNAMWNYRLFRLTGDGKYLDVFERALYNGLLSGVSLGGDKFFYVNPLESKGQNKREAWFKCACCPPNVARFIASLPGYFYAKADDIIYVNMFAACEGEIKLKDNAVKIKQQTRYPWEGAVNLTFEPTKTGKFAVAVRIPGWTQGKPTPSDLYRYIDSGDRKIGIKLNGAVIEPAMKNGFAFIERKWQKGDVIELGMPMPARRVLANANVAADMNKVAIERGPVVYCAEWPDNDGDVIDLILQDNAMLTAEYRDDLLGGATVIRGDNSMTLIPYYAWANRGQGPMAVWLLRDKMASEQEEETQMKIIIDANRTAEPISKYIYGQFIEHLGRCIYGGMWAEMLEDRKFYYPITDNYQPLGTADDAQRWKSRPYKYLKASPWKVIGPAGTVTMDTNNPYVGQHMPVIHLSEDGNESGISQEGLAILKGKGYTGRIILAGDEDAGPIVVRIVPVSGEAIDINVGEVSGEFRTHNIGFTSPVSSDNVRLEIVGKGMGTFRIGTLSLMPADNIKGWRSDVVTLLKDLNSPVYRWPGGNFVSGYDWRDGIGERDKRPPRKNPAWKGVEHDDVGIDEYMELMEIIGAEPFIAVNTGLGTIEEAAAEVEYCNGSVDTPMGKLRAQNGHLEPYGVKWWAVGNEMFGDWQLGHMPLLEYVEKHNHAAEAIWKVDPNAKLVGVGNVGKWSEAMLRTCGDYMNLISEHIYCKENKDVVKHTKLLARMIKRTADAHRKYRRDINELSGKDIRIAMDEWNYWYGDYIYGELGTRYYLKDGLGVATGLHEFFRNSDLYFMANYAQTVNVIGAIKTTKTAAAFETTGLVLKMYRRRFGEIPVEVKSSHIGPIDVMAALTSDRNVLTIGIVNPTDKAYEIPVEFKNVRVADKGKQWIITGTDPMAFNEPGKEPKVMIEDKTVLGLSSKLSVPALSVSIFGLEVQKQQN